MNRSAGGGPPEVLPPAPPPAPQQTLPIEIGPNALQAVNCWIEHQAELEREKLKGERLEYETEVQLERTARGRSFWLLVAGASVVIVGSTTLFFRGEVNYAALLMTHALTFWAGWGTRSVASRYGAGEDSD